MSLKSFHIFFILLSIILAFAFGVWGVRDYGVTGRTMHLGLGIASFISSLALSYYLFGFFRKIKHLLLFLALFLSSKTALACSVCFGGPNAALSKGMDLAVLFLMGVVGSVLLAIASIGMIWSHRARKLDPTPPSH